METNVEVIPNELIRYRITRGGVLKNHEGVMRFAPSDSGSRLDYTIEFDGRLPGAATIAREVLSRTIPRGLRRFAERS